MTNADACKTLGWKFSIAPETVWSLVYNALTSRRLMQRSRGFCAIDVRPVA